MDFKEEKFKSTVLCGFWGVFAAPKGEKQTAAKWGQNENSPSIAPKAAGASCTLNWPRKVAENLAKI